MSKTARCEICKTRPQMPQSRMQVRHGVSFPYCEPCLVLADWENTHTDEGHDDDSMPAPDCWICHPELDETQKEYRERMGTSRLGVKHHVAIRASGREKAEQVAAQLSTYGTKIRTFKGVVTLKASGEGQSFTISWYVTGQLITATITEGETTRKLRNAAEVIRNS